jgi:hypothetical protein
MLFSLWFAVLIILTGSFLDSCGWQLNGSIYLDSKPRFCNHSQFTISMSSHQPRSIPEVRDGDFVGVDAFGGASCFGRAVVDIVRSRGGHAYIIVLDNVSEAEMRQRYSVLGSYLDDGSIIYFQIDLYQFSEDVLPTLLSAYLQVSIERIDWLHVSIDCRSFSWASLSNIASAHRTVEGAALSTLAITHNHMLYLMFQLSDWLIKVNPDILITFESPFHGSFKSQHLVQERLWSGSGWWLLHTGYCAAADEQLDGANWVVDGEYVGGWWPHKRTSVFVFGLGDLAPQPDILPVCNINTCRMVVPNKTYHAYVLCSRAQGLQPGQQRTPISDKALIPKGLFYRLFMAHVRWLEIRDGSSSWCYKCGEGGQDLLMCDSAGCNHVQHASCLKLCDPRNQDWWVCDLCYIKQGFRA